MNIEHDHRESEPAQMIMEMVFKDPIGLEGVGFKWLSLDCVCDLVDIILLISDRCLWSVVGRCIRYGRCV